VDEAFSLEKSVSKRYDMADNAIRVIKEGFQLPNNAKPKWYLENDIDLKVPDDYLLPSKSPFSTMMWRKN